jgi:3-hydroxyacyl-CoA dehydrogenase
LTDQLIGQGLASVKVSLQRIARKLFKDDAAKGSEYVAASLGRIEGSVDLKAAVAGTDLVIESIVENIGAKHALFRTIDAVSCKIFQITACDIKFRSHRSPRRAQSLLPTLHRC